MRILFAGSAALSVPSLERIHANFTVCAVLTNPDRSSGRGRKLRSTEVKTRALELGLPVFEAEKLDSVLRERIAELKPDILVVVAYGKIFGPRFLSLFPLGGINMHPSLLPRYRGPSPLNAVIMNQEKETGITIQKVALEMDSGDILFQERFPLKGDETALSLANFVATRGAPMLSAVLKRVNQGTVQSFPQDPSQATYCALIKKEDGIIDWHESAVKVDAQVRAYYSWPLARTSFKGRQLSILKAKVYESTKKSESAAPGFVLGIDKPQGILVQTGSGLLCVEKLQLQNMKALEWKAFLNGTKDFVGSILGEELR